MEIKEAVAIAKDHLNKAFVDEIASPPTLEEVWFDEREDEWCITLGVRRKAGSALVDIITGRPRPDYRTVRVSDKDGKPTSIKIRD